MLIKYIKDIIFSPFESIHELLEAYENTEKIAVDSWPLSRRGLECEGNPLYVLVDPYAQWE